MTKLKVPNSCWTLTEVSAHQTNTRWFLMDRLEQVQVTGVGMNGCSMGSDSENTQGLLLYSLTVINNVVHKDWNLINIFKLCFDIFSSSYKTLAQLCGYTGALTVWTTHPLEADCVWLLTTKAPKSRFSQHLKTAPSSWGDSAPEIRAPFSNRIKSLTKCSINLGKRVLLKWDLGAEDYSKLDPGELIKHLSLGEKNEKFKLLQELFVHCSHWISKVSFPIKAGAAKQMEWDRIIYFSCERAGPAGGNSELYLTLGCWSQSSSNIPSLPRVYPLFQVTPWPFHRFDPRTISISLWVLKNRTEGLWKRRKYNFLKAVLWFS